MRVAEKIQLDAPTDHQLRVLFKRRRIEARLQQRVRVILLAAKGWQNKEIVAEIDLDRRQVALWRKRFLDGGIDALSQNAPRSGRTPTITAEVESRILEVTVHSTAKLPRPRTGARAPWPSIWASAPLPLAACGAATASSRTWRAASSSRATRASRTSCWTWSACT